MDPTRPRESLQRTGVRRSVRPSGTKSATAKRRRKNIVRRLSNSLREGQGGRERRLQGTGGPDAAGDPPPVASRGADGRRTGRPLRHEQAVGVAPLRGAE